jgi:hypothetical protein
MEDLIAMGWQTTPPDSEGLWWLYGEEEFGTMGGNYTGVYLPDIKLHMVEVVTLGSGSYANLQGICGGRLISLAPFNLEERKPGFVGVWQKATIPPLPNKERLADSVYDKNPKPVAGSTP